MSVNEYMLPCQGRVSGLLPLLPANLRVNNMKTIKFNNLVDSDGNTIEVEVPDNININEEIQKIAKLSTKQIIKHIQECADKGLTKPYSDY